MGLDPDPPPLFLGEFAFQSTGMTQAAMQVAVHIVQGDPSLGHFDFQCLGLTRADIIRYGHRIGVGDLAYGGDATTHLFG
ncbi:hypothetical protein GALL_552290 [mine drainage metagenome]|uniref:Uncharacterized protein n=1 Tax=mine drainage metagenome TaxID=410659 RepID=A0A1J5PI43_9ZZZZ